MRLGPGEQHTTVYCDFEAGGAGAVVAGGEALVDERHGWGGKERVGGCACGAQLGGRW